MSALPIEHLEHVCQLDPPDCRRVATTFHAHDPSANPEAPTPPHEPTRPLGAIDLSPVSAYEIVTRQMIEATQRDVAEIKGRINNLMVMVCGAVLVNIVLRMAGLG